MAHRRGGHRSYRARAADLLTPAERRVAELAARGAPNREIAATLVVTERTVEYHLTAAYRKLGIASRRELAALSLRAAAENPGVDEPSPRE
jgi:DNA-binding NarL/FixJ family response regulator